MSGNQGHGEGLTNMPRLKKEMFCVVHHFLREEGLHDSAHSLERDTLIYFDLKYFEELIISGRWTEVDWYLRGYFTEIQGNIFGLKMIFEVYKQKYYEALYRLEMEEAHEILQTELRSILSDHPDVYRELAGLLLMNNFREHPLITEWDNSENARATLRGRMRNLVVNCPDLQDKLHIPTVPHCRLISLMTQSFNWQHYLCDKKLPAPILTTFLKDHDCSEHMSPPVSMNISRMLGALQNFGPSPASTNVGSAPGPRAVDVRNVPNVGESSQQAHDCLDSKSTDILVTAKRLCASEPSTFVEQSAHQTVPESSKSATLMSDILEEVLSADQVLMRNSNLSINGDAASRTRIRTYRQGREVEDMESERHTNK